MHEIDNNSGSLRTDFETFEMLKSSLFLESVNERAVMTKVVAL
jgi:hypothetical protein